MRSCPGSGRRGRRPRARARPPWCSGPSPRTPRARRPTGRRPRRAWWPGPHGPCPPSTATAPTAGAPPETSTTPGCFAKRSSSPCSPRRDAAVGRRGGRTAGRLGHRRSRRQAGRRRGQAPRARPWRRPRCTARSGDAGAASALLGLVHACAEGGSSTGSGPGVIGTIGYGGGRATAVVRRRGAPRPRGGARGPPRAGTARQLRRGVAGPGPARAHGRSHPDGPAARGGRLRAGQPRDARPLRGTLPGVRDDLDPAVDPPHLHRVRGVRARGRVAGAPGRVQTFVVNQTMPPPFQAPLPLVIIDLEDGARLMVQGSPADAAELAIGRRGHAVAAPLRARAGHPRVRLQGVPGRPATGPRVGPR